MKTSGHEHVLVEYIRLGGALFVIRNTTLTKAVALRQSSAPHPMVVGRKSLAVRRPHRHRQTLSDIGLLETGETRQVLPKCGFC